MRTLTYVVADIHGRGDRFHQVLEKVNFAQTDELYILGDVIDRNPDGILLLEEIMGDGRMHMLLGNHEYMMLDAVADPLQRLNEWYTTQDLWYLNGGEVTEEAFYRLDGSRQQAILDFIRGLPLNIELSCGGKDYLLAHGSPASSYDPTRQEYLDVTEFAVWNRFDPRIDRFDPARILICGHTPTIHLAPTIPMEVFRKDNVLCIDCGCAYPTEEGGRLACLCLETDEILYSTL